MGSKRDRYRAKLVAREIKAAEQQSNVVVINRKTSPITNLTSVLRPAFKVRNEQPENHAQFFSAITSLINHRGNIESFQFLYTRLTFGRIIAMDYFTEEVAEKIHYALGNMIINMDAQLEENPEGTDQDMSVTPEIGSEIHECLGLIEDMAAKISPDEYELSGVKLINLLQTDGTAGEYNIIEWDEFKKREKLM